MAHCFDISEEHTASIFRVTELSGHYNDTEKNQSPPRWRQYTTSKHLNVWPLNNAKSQKTNCIILYFSLQVILTHGQQEAQIAIVCVPDISAGKTDFTHHLMQRILNPTCRGLAIICYLIIAVVYFVMPQLRDLVGNILTSISLCLITSQVADVVRIFTEFTSHVSFLIAGAFFKPAAILYVLK